MRRSRSGSCSGLRWRAWVAARSLRRQHRLNAGLRSRFRCACCLCRARRRGSTSTISRTTRAPIDSGHRPGGEGLLVLDASDPQSLKAKDKIKLDGSAEGYGVDDTRGVFYTNLEDKDRTVGIDVRTHQIVSSWPSQCGEKGPRGLALDRVHKWV